MMTDQKAIANLQAALRACFSTKQYTTVLPVETTTAT